MGRVPVNLASRWIRKSWIVQSAMVVLVSCSVNLAFSNQTISGDVKNSSSAMNSADDRFQDEEVERTPSDRPKSWTMGGQQFWTDLRIVGGWKIQRNEISGHCRVIDSKSYRYVSGSLKECEQCFDRQIAAGKIKPYEGEVVILLHGLMRSRRTMKPMARYLKQHGDFEPILFEYGSSRKDVASHAEALRLVLAGLGDEVTQVHFVGHSLGNIVVRHLVNDLKKLDSDGSQKQKHPNLGRMVMLGPPNQGSRMARLLKNSILFTTIAGVSGVQLSTTWEKLEADLAVPNFEFGIIAGAQKDSSKFSNYLLRGKDDFTVSVEETKLVGASDFLIHPLVHSSMMKKPVVLEATCKFLKNGYFQSAEKRNPITSLSGANSSGD